MICVSILLIPWVWCIPSYLLWHLWQKQWYSSSSIQLNIESDQVQNHYPKRVCSQASIVILKRHSSLDILDLNSSLLSSLIMKWIPMRLLLVNRQNFLKLGSILYHTHTALLYITPFTFPTHRFPHFHDTYFISFPSNFTLYQCIPKMNVLLLLTFKLDINGVCKYTPLKLTFFTQ